MGLNFKLIRRTSNTSASDITHSSSFAHAQNAGSFGASDSTTFSERQQIEQQRKFVRGYRNAKLARGVNMMPKARTAEQQSEMAQAAASELSGNNSESMTRQWYNAEREQGGGLQKYDARGTSSINRTAHNWGQQGSTAPRSSAASQRAARAERFSGKGFGRS